MKRISFLTYSLGFFLLTLAACSGSRKTTNQYETIVVKPADPSLTLPNASADTRLLIRAALFGLKRIYRGGYPYNKVGVMLMAIGEAHVAQGTG